MYPFKSVVLLVLHVGTDLNLIAFHFYKHRLFSTIHESRSRGQRPTHDRGRLSTQRHRARSAVPQRACDWIANRSTRVLKARWNGNAELVVLVLVASSLLSREGRLGRWSTSWSRVLLPVCEHRLDWTDCETGGSKPVLLLRRESSRYQRLEWSHVG